MITGFKEQTILTIDYCFGKPSNPRSNYRPSGRHRFQTHDWCSFRSAIRQGARRNNDHVALLEKLISFSGVDPANESRIDAQRFCKSLELSASIAIPGDNQGKIIESIYRAQEYIEPFDFSKPADE